MESTVNEIISILRQQYHFEIPPALEIRIKDLFDIGKISETGDYDKIIYAIYKRHSEMFSNKQFLEKAMRVIFEKSLKRMNVLMIGSDLGESCYSNIISFERELKQKSEIEVNYFIVTQSVNVCERIRRPSFDYDEILNATSEELHYLVNKIDYFTVRSDIASKARIIAGNPFNLPMQDNSMDYVILSDFSHSLVKNEIYMAMREIFRVISFDGICFSEDPQSFLSEKTAFIVDEKDNFTYYIKRKSSSPAARDGSYSLSDAIEFFKQKKYQESAMIIHNLISEKEDFDFELYKILLLIYIREGDIYKIEYLERVFRMHNIRNADYDFIIGSYYFNKSDYSTARLYLLRAYQDKPEFIFAMYYLAIIDKLAGRMDTSKERFSEILERIKDKRTYSPEFYSDFISVDMIEYIANNEIEGG